MESQGVKIAGEGTSGRGKNEQKCNSKACGILVVPIADHSLLALMPSVGFQNPAQASPCLRCVLKEGCCGWMWVLESDIYLQCSWSSY